MELDQDALNQTREQVKSERDKWLADYGALSNKMDVMQESQSFEKNSKEACKVT
jgi:chemotaxis protein MotB